MADIVNTALHDHRFKMLSAAIEAAGLTETLKGTGPFTVFAPTDDAFARLPEGTIDALLDDIPTLRNILLYHVVTERVPAADVVDLSTANTAQGRPLCINVDGDRVMINHAQVLITDIETDNGIIHVIDRVIQPPKEHETLNCRELMARRQ
jgi:uncharacterized surface protein with fasciclin (FAS1) repeats